MKYESTRGNSPVLSSAEAIKLGIAPDGGLFVPTSPVTFSPEAIDRMSSLSYGQRATFILKEFLTDYTAEELSQCVEAAYGGSKFDSPEVAPIKKLTGDTSILELWHGPTCAFKDMALQILPRFLVKALEKTGEKTHIVILVATSGDTGKAALEGFADVPGTSIVVFFPEQGVSAVQKRQMVTQIGGNVHVVAVRGNFDDAQSGVKQVFGDCALKARFNDRGFNLSSANSINWGRLVPQIVYYFSAYADLVKEGTIKSGEKINFAVPTGNFGNILAGFYARSMGLPIHRLICAANANNVLTDFINTGTYDRNREFLKTLSPSMDILISSNLERLLYLLTDRKAEQINAWMSELKTKGSYTVDAKTRNKVKALFWSGSADDGETLATIKEVWERQNYLLDTHTAVAVNVLEKYRRETGDATYTVVASTASPFKFNGSVAKALLGEETLEGKGEFALLQDLSSYTGWPIPGGLHGLEQRPVLHQKVVNKEQIGDAVQEYLLT
ncbi:threonine synthase [Desulforamulus ruminis]|uniref:Threonine synthase n=1 Tax=Desulforamulus ruminis (strain ATCC 23193 / DSM 2154 / NCIMB 8452 / DL) TaxID=696281 RepID=F6DQH3_DESRL|nr:threonine synthase [Desulforamulus ruminis]AEG60867.1 threonine synthase [Desulforamulus ruminis DSM 2154]